MQEKQWYSPEEAAEILEVDPDTIRRLCRQGKIPGAKQIGRQWRIPRNYVEAPPPQFDEERQRGHES